jgi:hypothetical protein
MKQINKVFVPGSWVNRERYHVCPALTMPCGINPHANGVSVKLTRYKRFSSIRAS